MHILITGGTGFIGQALCTNFLEQGFKVSVLTRSLDHKQNLDPRIQLVTELNEKMHFDGIINLAGESLNKHRWSKKVKQAIYDSRIETTQKIISYIQTALQKPNVLISGSAIGYYGSDPNMVFTESSDPIGENFPRHLCEDWEKCALQAESQGVRVCRIRLGVVLGSGGFLKEVLPLFKLGLGAQMGNGQQWFSWIHIDDVVGAVNFLLKNQELNGAFNLTAPKAVTNQIFNRTLAKILHRPLFLVFPPKLVNLLFGEMGGDLLLGSQKVYPSRLLKAGYQFKYPELRNALDRNPPHYRAL